MTAKNEDLVTRLGAIEDELTERIFDLLRDAVARGEAKRPAEEKRLTQARNAVTKALRLLSDDSGSGAGGGDG